MEAGHQKQQAWDCGLSHVNTIRPPNLWGRRRSWVNSASTASWALPHALDIESQWSILVKDSVRQGGDVTWLQRETALYPGPSPTSATLMWLVSICILYNKTVLHGSCDSGALSNLRRTWEHPGLMACWLEALMSWGPHLSLMSLRVLPLEGTNASMVEWVSSQKNEWW
jgi:hypothetical protein